MGSYIVPPLYIPPPPGLHMSGPVGMPMSYPVAYPVYQQPPNMVYNVNVAQPMPMPYSYTPNYPASYPVTSPSPMIPPQQAQSQQQPIPYPQQTPPAELPAMMPNQTPKMPATSMPDTLEKALKKQASQQMQTGLQAFFRGVTVAAVPIALLGGFTFASQLIKGTYQNTQAMMKGATSIALFCATAIGLGGGISAGWAYKDVAKTLLNRWFIKPATGENLLSTGNNLVGPVNVPQLPMPFPH